VAQLGFIRQLSGLREHRSEACSEVKTLLMAKLKNVRSKIWELEQLERELAVDLRRCNRELKHRQAHAPSNCPVLAHPGGKNAESC
jgi:hypothetical protein